MITRYAVDTPGNLADLYLAINQGAGYFDAAGNPAVYPMTVVQNGVVVATVPSDVYCAQLGIPPSVACAPALVIGLVAVLLIPLGPELDALLGTTVHGVNIPPDGDLVHVTRERDHALLPDAIRDHLDDRYVDGVFLGLPANDSAAVAAVIAELTPVTRARRAIRRLADRRAAA